MKVTISEARALRDVLVAKLTEEVQAFEQVTDLTVACIYLKRSEETGPRPDRSTVVVNVEL